MFYIVPFYAQAFNDKNKRIKPIPTFFLPNTLKQINLWKFKIEMMYLNDSTDCQKVRDKSKISAFLRA